MVAAASAAAAVMAGMLISQAAVVQVRIHTQQDHFAAQQVQAAW
tara:strand:- start:368 stop:499 length:132 start_codon:yes stop_codon:yes gene_type:complete